MHFLGGKIDFVLRNAGGPEQADDFGVFLFGESGKNRWRVLPEITRSALYFPLLIECACINFYFRADGAFVVGEGFEIDAHPVVLIGALVFENDGRPAKLRDDEVGASVARQIAYGDQIEPAVVVVIDCGDAPACLPAKIGEGNALEMLAVDVFPEADAGGTGVGEGEIHPAVFIEIEGDYADGGRKIFFFEIRAGERNEFSFTRIEIDGGAVGESGEDEIDGAVVVEIGGDEASAGGVDAEGGFGADVGKGAVAIVAPKNVVRTRSNY